MEGKIFKHYKGNMYKVLCVAMHSETLEKMVIYQDIYCPAKIWARPFKMWNETVSVNGKTVKRFEEMS